MSPTPRKQFTLGLLGLMLLALLTPRLARSAPNVPSTILDTFDTTQSVSVSGAPVGAKVATGEADAVAGTIVGGERDVVVRRTSNNSGFVSMDANDSAAGALNHSQATSTQGSTLVTYDGDDNNAVTLNPTGLGGIDLTTGGVDNAFEMNVRFDDLGGTVTVTVWTDATSCSAITKPLPSGIDETDTPVAVIFAYSDFAVGTGCTSLANFADVGAVQFLINGTQTSGLDVTVNLFETVRVDYGDLPASYNNTTLADTGAGHVITSTLYLGNSVDSEDDGQESANATGDDLVPTPDDEDGVIPTGVWTIGGVGQVQVTVFGNGCLNGWIDWNGDSDFADLGEAILNNQLVTVGTGTQIFNVPGTTLGGARTFFARFRLYPRDSDTFCTTTKAPTGAARGGEVEDYVFSITPLVVTLAAFEATPQDGAIQVAWQTGTEVDTLGFNILRGTAPDAPGERLNGALIPTQGGGTAYTWQDRTVEDNVTYYYWLEAVDVDGTTTRHGPVSAEIVLTAVTLSSLDVAVPASLPIAATLSLLLALAGVLRLRREAATR